MPHPNLSTTARNTLPRVLHAMAQADPTDDGSGHRLSGPDQITRPSHSFLDGALHPNPEHGQFTLAAFGNPYFDSSSYSNWETSIASPVQSEVGLDISYIYDDASSVLTAPHIPLNAQSASFVAAAQPIRNISVPSMTPRYSQTPPMPSPMSPWSPPWTQSQALSTGAAHGYGPTQYDLSNPALQTLGTQQRFPDDDSAVEYMASEPGLADKTAVAKSARHAKHRRPQSLDMGQTSQTKSKRVPRGTGIHTSSRSLSSSARKSTKPSIPGQFVFAVEPPQLTESRSGFGIEDINDSSMSPHNTYLVEDSHERPNLPNRRGSTSTIAAPSSGSHTLSGPATPTSSIWTMSSAQADLHESRARNRISAGRCRVKHRASVTRLKDKDREMMKEREELEEEVGLLKFEVFSLKEELLKHADCDCAVIREYLALEAQRIVDGAHRAFSQANQRLSEQVWD